MHLTEKMEKLKNKTNYLNLFTVIPLLHQKMIENIVSKKEKMVNMIQHNKIFLLNEDGFFLLNEDGFFW